MKFAETHVIRMCENVCTYDFSTLSTCLSENVINGRLSVLVKKTYNQCFEIAIISRGTLVLIDKKYVKFDH